MKNYKLYHKNKLLLNFEIQNFTPISCQIYIENTKYLPLPLKRIINNKEEFIDKTMSDVYMALMAVIYLIIGYQIEKFQSIEIIIKSI